MAPKLMTLATLPLELIELILSSLPDVQSLMSLILTCRTIHRTFRANEARITPHVVENHVGKDVLPEAIIALKSTATHEYQCDVQNFIDAYLTTRNEHHAPLTRVQAQKLYNLHFYVDKISTVIAQKTLANFQGQDGKVEALKRGPSATEINRIQRAVYRFETYRSVFSACYRRDLLLRPQYCRSYTYGEREQKGFFANFSPYENEQLCCVYDFLIRTIRPAFHYLRTDNFRWSTHFDTITSWNHDFDLAKTILAQGLAETWLALQTDEYEDRHLLLGGAIKRNYRGRVMSLRYGSLNASSDGFELRDYDENKFNDDDYSPFFDDPDHGPFTIWKWAHSTRDRGEFVHVEPNLCLRDRGYVFWDFRRLSHWPRFKKPWCAYFHNRDAEHELSRIQEREAGQDT